MGWKFHQPTADSSIAFGDTCFFRYNGLDEMGGIIFSLLGISPLENFVFCF
jgi:hypothetical protein